MSNWIGENENGSSLMGFKWRGGQKPETTGIWMWSEIFTHVYENGDKVAIVLVDTQGIFDTRSNLKDSTTIFALSMLLSSVQCYNVMGNIQEDHLHNLDLFTEYGRLALEQTNEKPFQKLIFIIRDWPFPYENPYGYQQTLIDSLMAGNDEQTSDMKELRKRITRSFKNITAFLMPHPGMTVVRGSNFSGAIEQIDTEFIKYVKELVPSIVSPENLVVKTINGESVRARDLTHYLEAYVELYNGDSIPEPSGVLNAGYTHIAIKKS